MSTHAFIPSPGLLVLVTLLFGLVWPAAAVADARVSETYGKLPLHFEANQGQTHEDVRFLSRGPGYSLYLTAGEAVLVLAKPNPDGKLDKHGAQARPEAQPQAHATPIALRMALVGANRKPRVTGLEELPGKANYFIGKDPAKWRTNVPIYGRVHYREVYPGIDLVYYGNQRQLEYDFVVAPGADPQRIMLDFKGADQLEIDAQGDLVLHTAGGLVHQKKPVIYQEMDGARHEIAGSYVRKGVNRVGFKLAAYDISRPLVIDPVVLSYSTFLGGGGTDIGGGLALDADGSAYITGVTNSIDFPTTGGSAGGTSFDIFVTKLNPTGSTLVYSTYVGGSGIDQGIGIAVDAASNAYVSGSTGSSDFPTTTGAFQLTFGGMQDAFLMKLDPTGSALLYSTYLGGLERDVGGGIAIDAAGNAYVTGYTYSSQFPTTAGAFQASNGGGNCPADASSRCADAFATKLNPAGSALVFSTYLGGSGSDFGFAIAVDAAGSAYVTGQTGLGNFPITAGAFQPVFGGSADAFVTKLDPSGSALIYSTYLGGGASDAGASIAIDGDGNAYVTGSTDSSDFPTTLGAFQPIYLPGDSEFPPFHAFVTKLNPTGSELVYSTYLGGSGNDAGSGIAVDASGNAYVTGATLSPNFPITPGAFQAFSGGGQDAFVTKLHSTGSLLLYSTYLGGSDSDGSIGIAVDASGNAYVTGHSASINFPIIPGAFQPVFGGGGEDAFVAKIVDDSVLNVVIDVNLGAGGVAQVAIHSSAIFDATQVNPATMKLAGTSVSNYSCSTQRDVNSDALADLVCQVETSSQLSLGPSNAVLLEAKTFAGQSISGTDPQPSPAPPPPPPVAPSPPPVAPSPPPVAPSGL